MPTQSNLKTDFSDEVEDTTTVTPAVAKDETGTPYCLKHHVRMKQTSGGKKGALAAHFGCPVEGCTETAKRIKTRNESSIPSEPTKCPRCSTPETPIILVRSPKFSTGFYSILACPNCNHKSPPLPRPEFVASQQGRARGVPVEGIGDR